MRTTILLYFLLNSLGTLAQQNDVVLTGARFTYPLLEKWIADYKVANPAINIRIEPRTNVDPSAYDLLFEAFEPDAVIQDREYLHLGKYAILPVANASSAFSRNYAEEGLTSELIRQVFFHDIYASREDLTEIRFPLNLYTRVQKAGAPKAFARYFGFEQQQIKGKAIAGADEHLVKAILKDSIGVSYAALGLIYDLRQRKPLNGLTILPVDANDNGRVSKEEKFYSNLDDVIARLESDELRNIPQEYFHVSIRKHAYKPEALKFLLWIIENSQDDLHNYGFLKPEQSKFDTEKEKFQQLALKKTS